jgi:hypothetical protein
VLFCLRLVRPAGGAVLVCFILLNQLLLHPATAPTPLGSDEITSCVLTPSLFLKRIISAVLSNSGLKNSLCGAAGK